MKSLQKWFDEYGESHQNPTNKLIHWFCVPIIFACAVGLLSLIPFHSLSDTTESMRPFSHTGSLALVLVLLFYLRHSINMALAMALFGFAVLCLVRLVNTYAPMPLVIYLSLFVLAWVGQFYGHRIEGKKPSFFKDLQFLLIGPAWLMGFIFRKAGIRY